MVDEAYVEFADAASLAARHRPTHPGLVVLRTLSKAMAWPARAAARCWRMPTSIALLRKVIQPYASRS